MLEKQIGQKKILTDKLKSFFVYTGWALSCIFGIVYIVLLIILIFGFKVSLSFNTMLLLSILSAVFTFAISVSFMYQGVAFAKDLDDNKAVMNEYRTLMNQKKKEKSIHTISFYMTRDIIVSFIFKGGMVFLSTYAMINFIVEGIGDIMILWLGISNLLMAVGFGMLGLVNSFDDYIEKHIPAIKVKIQKIKEGNNNA